MNRAQFAGRALRGTATTVAFTLITIALVLSAVGCGGSSSSGGGGNGTPAGTYTVSVTGTDGTTSHTTEVAVAVQ